MSIADRLRRLAKRREDEGIYTDAALCAEAADLLTTLATQAWNRRAPSPSPAPGVVEALREARRGMDMVHDGLMDPTRPRQAVGEVAAS